MKRNLYLLRHSYAEAPGAQKDIERELTMKGVSTARSLGRKLLADRFKPGKIISSTAVRAMQTSLNVAEELNINDQMIDGQEKLYESSVRELMEMVNSFDNSLRNVLLVAHNPSISYFAELITNEDIGSIEPCGLVIVSFKDLSWAEISQGTGGFETYYHPDR